MCVNNLNGALMKVAFDDRPDFITPASLYNDTGYPQRIINRDDGDVRQGVNKSSRQTKQPIQSLLDVINGLKLNYEENQVSNDDGNDTPCIADHTHMSPEVIPEQSTDAPEHLPSCPSKQSIIDAVRDNVNDAPGYNEGRYDTCESGKYQVHKRILGWKLTSRKRRKELVGLLDLINLNRQKNSRQDLVNGVNIVNGVSMVNGADMVNGVNVGNDIGRQNNYPSPMREFGVRPSDVLHYKQLVKKLVQESPNSDIMGLLDPSLVLSTKKQHNSYRKQKDSSINEISINRSSQRQRQSWEQDVM